MVYPDIAKAKRRPFDVEARLAEAVGLAQAIALRVMHAEAVRLVEPRPATLFGSGTVERLADLVTRDGVELVVVDASITPIQQRNLERAWSCKVIDRTALILEIFGARARTREGRLQVELAHLNYQRSRLVRSWTHLERQRGGLGFVGGPGETQLEIDRRLIGERIAKLDKELETVRQRRALHRTARQRVPFPVVALVGYTNAGKSTLFNRLTGASVTVADQLFATLDPTMRALDLPSNRKAILSDTVGFISDLPTQLVAAFRATLEEVTDADVVVHVRDVSHPDCTAQKQEVEAVLKDLGVDEDRLTGVIEALNKIDLVTAEEHAHWYERSKRANAALVPLSAVTGEGTEALLETIDRQLNSGRNVEDYRIALSDGAAIAWLYQRGEILERRDDTQFAYVRVRLDPADAERFCQRQRQS